MTAQVIQLDSRRKRVPAVVTAPVTLAASWCITLGMLFVLFGMATCYMLQGRK